MPYGTSGSHLSPKLSKLKISRHPLMCVSNTGLQLLTGSEYKDSNPQLGLQ